MPPSPPGQWPPGTILYCRWNELYDGAEGVAIVVDSGPDTKQGYLCVNWISVTGTGHTYRETHPGYDLAVGSGWKVEVLNAP